MDEIIGIGCDLASHDLTNRLGWTSNTVIQKRIFSNKELEIYRERKALSFLCGRFAAKEALLKSLGIGMEDGIRLNEISILRSRSGQPFVELQGEIKQYAERFRVGKWKISISHGANFSMAVVIAIYSV
jgi:holo-[acyl-carrier protein] synthase